MHIPASIARSVDRLISIFGHRRRGAGIVDTSSSWSWGFPRVRTNYWIELADPEHKVIAATAVSFAVPRTSGYGHRDQDGAASTIASPPYSRTLVSWLDRSWLNMALAQLQRRSTGQLRHRPSASLLLKRPSNRLRPLDGELSVSVYGSMKPGDRKIDGIVALAQLAGVSPSTVSRALANNPVIAEVTRRRIHALAAEHGFRLNQAASAFRRRRAQAIGVAIPLGHEVGQSLSDPFFMAMLGHLADALAVAGYDLLLSRIIPREDRWLSDLIDTGRTDGLIVIGQSNQIDAIEATAARYDRMVVWGAHVPGLNQVTVGTDNEAGGRIAAGHLIARGRRRLAFLGNPDVPEFAARYRGFANVVASASVETDMLPVHLTTGAAYQDVAAFLTNHPAPDGVVAASDVIAMSAIQALAERGLRVPEDVSVVGYDDVALARLTTPPLTTVRQDVERGAELLVSLLLRRINNEPVESVELAPELVVRGSS